MTSNQRPPSNARPQPRLRIALFNDLHIGSTRANAWHNRFLTDRPEETLAAGVDAVNSERPDIVIVAGDLSDLAAEDELRRAREGLERLAAPWIVCRGNHDLPDDGDHHLFERIFAGHAPIGFVTPDELPLPDGVMALVLDAAWGHHPDEWRAEIPHAQVEAAVTALRQGRPALLLVICHFPFVRQSEHIRELSPDGSGKNAGTLWEGQRVIDALAAEVGTLLAFAGHQHFHHMTTGPNWLHCTTASLAEYPAEYRIIEIDPDGVLIRTIPAAPHLIEANPPEVTWVRGREEDRELRWP
jgi:hypothetical protein